MTIYDRITVDADTMAGVPSSTWLYRIFGTRTRLTDYRCFMKLVIDNALAPSVSRRLYINHGNGHFW